MIRGTVNADFDAIVNLSICSSKGKVCSQDAIIDTGFNGWLSLPPDLIAKLNLKWKRRGRAILGDGSECIFNVYEAVIVWDESYRTIPIDEADSEAIKTSFTPKAIIMFCQTILRVRSAIAFLG